MSTALLQTFPTQAHESRSERYTFIDSRKLIEMLQERGFELQSIKRGKRGKSSVYGRHIVTMRNNAFPKIDGDGEFTLTFINSFDGSSRFKMMVGYFRIICENGMIIMDSGETTGAIKHINHTAEEIYQEAMEIVAKAVEAEKKVRKARETLVTNEMETLLVDTLKPLIQDRVKGDLTVFRGFLFDPHRDADQGKDLWTVLNVAQENLLRGMPVYVSTEKGLKKRKLRSVENNPKQVEKVNTVIAQLLNKLTA